MYPLGNVSICYMSIRYIALLTRKTTKFIPPWWGVGFLCFLPFSVKSIKFSYLSCGYIDIYRWHDDIKDRLLCYFYLVILFCLLMTHNLQTRSIYLIVNPFGKYKYIYYYLNINERIFFLCIYIHWLHMHMTTA